MLDTLYPWLVSFLTVALDLAPALLPKQFERRRYRIAAGICGILLGIGTFAEMEHERREREKEQHKAATDREAAIQETSVRVAAGTSASVADVLGKQFAETVVEVRNMKQATVASTAQIHALWGKTKNGEQKRQNIKEQINHYVAAGNNISLDCAGISLPGYCGTNAGECLSAAKVWTSGVAGYLSGSLGQLYVNRFFQSALPSNYTVGVDPRIDQFTASLVSAAARLRSQKKRAQGVYERA